MGNLLICDFCGKFIKQEEKYRVAVVVVEPEKDRDYQDKKQKAGHIGFFRYGEKDAEVDDYEKRKVVNIDRDSCRSCAVKVVMDVGHALESLEKREAINGE